MLYTKEYLVEPLPSIFNNDTKSLESSFSTKCNILRTTLFPSPPITSRVILDNYTSSTKWN